MLSQSVKLNKLLGNLERGFVPRVGQVRALILVFSSHLSSGCPFSKFTTNINLEMN